MPGTLKMPEKYSFPQASRESQRAAALRFLNRDKEAEVWSLRSSEAFAKCATFWKKTPALPDLKVAEALMQANAGNTNEAIEMLKLISTKNSEQIFPVIQYYLGQLYLKKDDDKQADAYFKKAWAARPGFDSGIDNLLEGVAGGMKELEMMIKVRLICNTKWTPEMGDYIKNRLGVQEESFFKLDVPCLKEMKSIKKKEKISKPEKQPEIDFEIEMIE